MIRDFFISFFGDFFILRWKFMLALGLPILLIGPFVWAFYYQYYLLNKFLPFENLDGKVALNIGAIQDRLAFEFTDNDDEIFLLDTVSGAIRQLTQDDYDNIKPFASSFENKVYFLSNRRAGFDSYKQYDLYSYQLGENSFKKLSEPLSTCHIEDSYFSDLLVKDNLLLLIQTNGYDYGLIVLDIKSQKCVLTRALEGRSIIWEVNQDYVTVKQMGNLLKIKLKTVANNA